MDGLVESNDSLYQDVLVHLGRIQQDTNAALLDEDLLRRAERNIDSHISRQILWQLLHTGEELLQTLQQDPRPLTRLLASVVLQIPFDELKKSITSEKLEQGLLSPSIPVQLLILAYLQKAADLPSGAAFVGCSPSLTRILIETWLASNSTEIADKALDVIVALLSVDNPSSIAFVSAHGISGEAKGQDLLWRRVFEDADIYSLLFAWTSTKKSKHDLKTRKGQQQVTISQGRLFDFIARIAQIDWKRITTSTLPEVEKQYCQNAGLDQPYGGILRYAASDMIDPKDILMEVLRQDFFMNLLGVVEENGRRGVSSVELRAIQQSAGVPVTESGAPRDGLHL